ncbi:MAG: hypothetical protein CVU90_05125 [Firmicutes bacterium HGW-Firmicutes-15]|nr:MAG: hypothetical protein CVU90_05125 [Firmicutes bacterium HGW-Firmicutes-15]
MSFEINNGKFMERFYTVIAIIVGIIFLIGLLGQEIMIGKNMPPNIILYVDETTNTYYAPPYIDGKKYPSNLSLNSLKRKTFSEVKINKYKADSNCVELGYFDEKTTLTNNILVRLGWVKPNPSRWNPDGSWNW